MIIHKRFPLTGYASVKIEGGTLGVKYKFPSHAQVRAMSEEGNVGGMAMAICKYTIEDIDNLQDEDGQKVKVQLNEGPGGLELSDDFVAMLFNNNLAGPLAMFYRKTLEVTEADKKKLEPLPNPSEPETRSKTEPET